MILQAYYDALNCAMRNTSMNIKARGGSTYSVSVSSCYKLLQLASGMSALASGGSSGIILGTGTTPVKLTDNQISGTQITAFGGSGKVASSYDAKSATVTTVITVTNTGNTDVTVGEVAVQLNYTGNWAFLVERTVLETPVTVPAGGVGQITYTVKLVYPTE